MFNSFTAVKTKFIEIKSLYVKETREVIKCIALKICNNVIRKNHQITYRVSIRAYNYFPCMKTWKLITSKTEFTNYSLNSPKLENWISTL